MYSHSVHSISIMLEKNTNVRNLKIQFQYFDRHNPKLDRFISPISYTLLLYFKMFTVFSSRLKRQIFHDNLI